MSSDYTFSKGSCFDRDQIKVGRRLRRDLGDIKGLAKSIDAVGLLHPVVVRSNGKLISGVRRLKALDRLGWEKIPVTVVHGLKDLGLALRAEKDENTSRKDLLPSELVARIDEAVAEERKLAARRHGKKFADEEKGKSDERAAKTYGVSRRTYRKAKDVVEKAKKDPKRYKPVADEMDRNGKVDGAWKDMKRIEQGKPVELSLEEDARELIDGIDKSLKRFAKKRGGWDKIAMAFEDVSGYLREVVRPFGLMWDNVTAVFESKVL